ncbi:MAG: restriction endonuclease subunit S [Smithella sp.]
MKNLLTENIDIWTSVQIQKNGNGRGNGRGNGSANQSLYGIKKLRELILELAVRGKLVPQDPKDEPASVLLEKIAKEKAQLIKAERIKKEKLLPKISEDEKPFELPNSWSWTRLGNITNYGISDKVEPGQVSENTWILELEDVEKETSKLLQKIRCNVRKFQSSKNKFNKGDVIYGKLRPYLDKVIIADEDGICTTEMIPLKGYKCLTSQFIRLVMKSPYFIHYADESTHGMNLPRLGTDKARLALFPLVCEHAQHRIVAKVDELMVLCDKLEQQQAESNTAHQTLFETLLSTLTSAADANEFNKAWQRIAENFDTLFTTEQSIDQLKRTILQLAVMGKLVPQDPKDEPASVLLEKITKEKARLIKEGKIKKEKFLPEIIEDEKIYSLPESWEWARLTDVYYPISPSGKKLKSSETVEKGSYPVVDQGKSYIAGYTENANLLIKIPGPVIIFGDHTMEMKYINFNFVAGADGTKILRPYKMDERYFYIYLLSYKLENKGYARHFKVLNDNLIALPPLLEQHRIVAKVDELMALCDKLKDRLKEAQTTQIQLADAIVEQAVG